MTNGLFLCCELNVFENVKKLVICYGCLELVKWKGERQWSSYRGRKDKLFQPTYNCHYLIKLNGRS